MLHVGVSITCIFNGNFNAECAVRSPSKRVAAIPDDTIASEILFCDLIVARIIEIRKVLPVPPSASKKYKPQLLLDIAFIIVLYAVRVCCSNTNFGI
ncbi:transposon Tf2-6 polyprotein [Trichonephila clavipes]|nr:transposon Tf2-6 polyprotein [Trichonephila clavipes]